MRRSVILHFECTLSHLEHAVVTDQWELWLKLCVMLVKTIGLKITTGTLSLVNAPTLEHKPTGIHFSATAHKLQSLSLIYEEFRSFSGNVGTVSDLPPDQDAASGNALPDIAQSSLSMALCQPFLSRAQVALLAQQFSPESPFCAVMAYDELYNDWYIRDTMNEGKVSAGDVSDSKAHRRGSAGGVAGAAVGDGGSNPLMARRGSAVAAAASSSSLSVGGAGGGSPSPSSSQKQRTAGNISPVTVKNVSDTNSSTKSLESIGNSSPPSAALYPAAAPVISPSTLSLSNKGAKPIDSRVLAHARSSVSFNEAARRGSAPMDEAATQDSAWKPPMRICGYILKRGQMFPSWKKRWFVLSLGVLTYYQSPLEEFPFGSNKLGDIPSLLHKTLELQDVGPDVFLLNVSQGPGWIRGISLKFTSLAERSKWEEALQSHIKYCSFAHVS
jgi:hypothetical protein